MTDKEVQDMEEFVGDCDPQIELIWAKEQHAEVKMREGQLVAAWKMWKFMRDERMMETVAADLKKARQCLAYLESRIKQYA